MKNTNKMDLMVIKWRKHSSSFTVKNTFTRSKST